MRIERFEDLICWQKARALANCIYDLTGQQAFQQDWDLRHQMQSAAGSVMHNIAEGFDAGSDAEFERFLKYARRSASEVQSQLYLALDRHYMTEADFRQAFGLTREVKQLLNALIGYLHSGRAVREEQADYHLSLSDDEPEAL